MKLKRLEISGFKSFADRTSFEFGRGLTGVVGPNGCGKSNVVDAIRWVLGEQRPTQLRGTEMLDVIFKGSARRDALGFAEVTIVLDNEGGGLPSEYSEVSLTRRLFRTGDSEYLVNRKPARLKDLRELLLDTGLGVHSYTILEQGKIDAILSANPLERRAIFEEASGISRFRARRKEAVRKIEQVQQNLLRLNDLLGELESGIRSLKIQASKVRRYREFQERFRALKISLAQQLYQNQSVEYEKWKTEREQRETEISSLREARERFESQMRLLEEELGVLQSEISRMRNVLDQAKASEAAASEKLHALEVRSGEWVRESKSLEERETAILDSVKQKEDEQEKLIADLEKSREVLALAQRNLETQQSLYREISLELKERNAALEEAQKLVLDFLHRRTESQNRRVELESLCRSFETDRERLQSRHSEIAQILNFRKQRESQLSSEQGEIESRSKELELELIDVSSRRIKIEEDLSVKEKEFFELEQRLSAFRSKQELLSDLAKGREGLDEGVKNLLEAPNSFSLLADRVQIEPLYARALETALLGRAQALVTFDARSASASLSQLRERRGGRAVFALAGNAKTLSLDSLPTSLPGVMGRLFDQVRCEDSLRPLLMQWIGDCVLVESAERAQALCSHYPQFTFLTPEGDLFRHDLWIGGEAAKESGPIARRSLLDALDAEIQGSRVQRDRAQFAREELKRTTQQEKIREEEIKAHQAKLSRESAVRGAGVEEAKGEIRRLEEERDLIERELKGISEESISAQAQLKHLLAESNELELQFQEANDTLKKIQASKLEKDAIREELAREESEARLKLEQLRGFERTILGQREFLANSLLEMRQEKERISAQLDALEEKRRSAQEEMLQLSQKRDQSLEERAQIEQDLANLREREEVLQSAVREKRASAEKGNQEFEAKLGALSEAKLEEQKIQLSRTEIVNRIREEFQIELVELPALEAVIDSIACEKEISEIREKIDRLGSLNLDAVRELEEKEQRFEFLNSQKKDLEESKKLLEETIRKIDEESRERFATTFAAVREHFQTIFRQLFRGGKADLSLEEGVDLLEAGILIQAKPPGKELRNIELLSGGERTLTALAMLFALFRSKPSPFCLLDEVDAALDDANIERFLGVLTEFTQESQFLLVTHNKRTMTACQVLYGVTMQDNGVSKKVAVELGDGEEVRLVAENKVALLEPQTVPSAN